MARRMGKTIAMDVDMLHKAFTNSDHRCLVVCPYKSQVAVVFSTLNRLIGDSDDLRSSIEANKTNPYYIKFFNGSEIIGFTAGTRAGQKGDSIRGQWADSLYLDEVDYMGTEAINSSIMPIFTDHDKTTVWASSTPTGKREDFWRWCTMPELGWEQHHYRSSDRPDWTAQLEAEIRLATSDMDYLHEYEAEFGEEVVGVFSHAHIDACTHKYAYTKDEIVMGMDENDKPCREVHTSIAHEYNPRNVYVFGIDWNSEGNGVQIVVIEEVLDPPKDKEYLRGKYRVFYRESITLKGFTQTQAVIRTGQLAKVYNPMWIVVDEGYGAMQIESLRKYGLDHPESGFAQKILPVNMASKVEIRDPISGLPIEKPMKPFMVNSAVILVERHLCVFPERENETKRLLGQMRAYTVERRSSMTGAPVYSGGNDHILDAWMMALLGFVLKRSDLGRYKTSNLIKRTETHMNKILSQINDRWDGAQSSLKPLGYYAPVRQPKLSGEVAKYGLGYEYTRDKRPEELRPTVSSSSSQQRGFRQVPTRTLSRSRTFGGSNLRRAGTRGSSRRSF